VFAKDAGFEEMLHTAMDLEKGAWRFYRAALEKAAGTALETTLLKLAEAETAHARSVYQHWAPTQDAPQAFDRLFEDLSGEILEGGASLADVVGRVDELDGDPCLNLIELALHIEYSAYDLYRTVAESAAETRAKNAFLSIAQAEKGHMRMLTRAVAGCES
jgi:rubrerythrin